MTVMFCDMVGSTPLAESLDPEDFRELLRAYQHACAEVVERYDGWIAQWAGDGLVAYFGYPRVHEDDAHRAIHAGLAIVEAMVSLSDGLDADLQVRVGLHSGLVIAGESGTGAARLERAAVGATPHVAARLEGIAEPGTVVISDSTRELVDGFFDLEPLGERELKGVTRPLGVYRVRRFTGAVGRLDVAARSTLRPMVGRDAELARLQGAWRRATEGLGAIVHVRGEAGIGKSRLIRALTDQVGAAQVWQCSAHHRSTSLYPVVRELERTFDGPEQLARAAGTAGLDPDETVPLLSGLLAGKGEDRPGRSPLASRTATLRALELLLVADPARQPLLLVVEDLHWADPTTVELLGRIAPRLREQSVLCVATYRRDFEPPWPCELCVELGPLSPADVRAMAGPDVDLSAADGVPLFVEELLKSIEDGEDAGAVPATLHGLLTQRLERLPALSEVIDVAAVLGREFEREQLAGLVPLDGALAQLTAHEVIRPVEGASGRFEFTHALLWEAAYARVLRRRRQALHARVAELLTERFAELVGREPELAAHHFARAVLPARAVPYWQAAGELALRRAAFLEAADHFRLGLEALDEAGWFAGDRATLLTQLGISLQAGIGYAAPGVDEAYAEAREMLTDGPLVPIIRGQWSYHLLRAQYVQAAPFADEMLELGERSGDPLRLADGHLRQGMLQMYVGDFLGAREHLTAAYANYALPEDSQQAAGDIGVAALAYLSAVLWYLGEPEESLERSDTSLSLEERVGGPVTRAQAWGMRSLLHLARSELTEFGGWIERAHAHSSEYNVGYWRALSSLLGGWMQARDGGLEAGRRRVDEGLQAYLRSGALLGLSRFYVLRAGLCVMAGDRVGALKDVAAAEQHIEQTGERYAEAELYRFKGRLLLDADPDGARAAFEHAVAAARGQSAVLLELRAATELAELERISGTAVITAGRVAELCERFSAQSPLRDVVRARALLASGVGAR
jgi:class 3 adenylate cyclase